MNNNKSLAFFELLHEQNSGNKVSGRIVRMIDNKLAIDFGNSNTVLALWNAALRTAETISLPEFSDGADFLIPSLIHYQTDGNQYIGNQIISQNLLSSPHTFRWMKRYISLRSPYQILIGNKRIHAQKAAEDFLNSLKNAAMQAYSFQLDDITLSVPIESFEYYENWLMSLTDQYPSEKIRIVDEASAAAAGYGEKMHPGEVFLLFDFGGSTMQTAAVVTEESEKSGNRFCRILGKAGCGIGGAVIDRWIYEDICWENGLSPHQPEVIQNSCALLSTFEKVKQQLSAQESVEYTFTLSNGRTITDLFTRKKLEKILGDNQIVESIHRLVKDTVIQAADHGYPIESIKKVIPVGGSCLIPMIQKALAEQFGSEKIVSGEPMGAVARGAACFAGGLEIYDFIQHEYAVRYRNPENGEYAFHTIVKQGTRYPTSKPASTLTIKAAFDQQSLLGLAIYEISSQPSLPTGHFEIMFNENGEVRLFPTEKEEDESHLFYWMNEQIPSFLSANPPAIKGEARFTVKFEIDSNKMLLISAFDLKSGEQIFSRFPVVRLS